MSMEQIKNAISDNGSMEFIQLLREKVLGRELSASGRTIVDEQGAMLLSDSASIVELDSVMEATEIRARWGLN